MSVFSYHIVTTSCLTSLGAILNPPKATNNPGLIHAECMTVMKLGANIFSPSRMQLRQLVVFAQWENEEALNRFLELNKLGKALADGWHIRLKFLRQWGHLSEFLIPDESVPFDNENTPVVAITIARMRLPEIPRFIRWGRPVEKLVRDHPGTSLSLASIRFPRTVSTFSIWRSVEEMTSMVQGRSHVTDPKRHVNAMKERDRKDFHFEFTTLRFKSISESGQWKGKSDYLAKLQDTE